MPAHALTDEQLEQAVRLYRELGNKQAVADQLGVTRSTVQHRIRVAQRRGLMGRANPAPEGFEVKTISETTDAHGNVKSRSTKYQEEGGGPYQVPDGHKVKGESVLTDGEGQIRARWIKTKEDELAPEKIAEIVRASFEGFTPKSPNIWRLKDHDDDLLTIYPLADWHLGMFAWGPETDGPDWDLKIAERVLTETFERVVQQAPPSRKAIIVGMGDLMHADSQKNQTPGSGNVLDVDTRHQKVLPKLCDILIECTEIVRHKHGEIEAEFKEGNHDPASTVGIRTGMNLFYRNDSRITVNLSPSKFWWHLHGVNFFCATHGDGAKISDIPGVMASYKPKMWGASTSRHAFTGHIHHETCKEVAGVRVWSLRAPIPSDAYHAAHGYRSGRSMMAFNFHRTKGSTGRTEAEIH